MKNKKWLYPVLALIVCGIGIWLFMSFFKANDFLNVLPAQPKALAVIDLPKLADEADLKDADQTEWKQLFEKYSESGLDWSKPFYAFVTSKENIGMLAAVSDEDLLDKTIKEGHKEGLCDYLDDYRGYKWALFDGSWLLGFNEDVALLMGPVIASDMNMTRAEMLRYFHQEKEESGCASRLFAEISERKSSVALSSTLDVLPNSFNETFKMGLPGHATLGDIRVVADCRFTPRDMIVNCEIDSDVPEVNKYYEKMTVINGKLKGVFSTDLLPNTLLWASANVEGKSLLNLLRKDPDIRTFLIGLNMGVDADRMISSIDGDVAIRIDSVNNSQNYAYSLSAELADRSFLNDADYWIQSARQRSDWKLVEWSENNFYAGMPKWQCYFGVQKNWFYLASSEVTAHNMFKQHSQVLSSWQKDLKESRFFIWVNMKEVIGLPMVKNWLALSGNKIWQNKLQALESFAVRSTDPRHIAFKLTSRKGTNLMNELLK